jgi:pyruvate dehydrogenase E1 component alpha subunit
LHLYIGEEAVAVGSINALRPNDDIVTHYRDHGHALAREVDTSAVMAELCGRATGVCQGRGGSMHVADASKKMWGGYAIVGGHLPMATGLAHAHKYAGEDLITSVFFGDAASDIGEFHEAMNFAALWKLPVLFICENNLYGMGVPLAMNSSVPQIVDKARAYNMPARIVDGMDVEAMYQATSEAASYIRSGQGPYFIEAMTYRFRGHSMADPELYRDKAEVEEWKKKDPIVTYREKLIANGVMTAVEADALELSAQEEANRAGEEASNAPFPAEDTLYDHIYATPLEA